MARLRHTTDRDGDHAYQLLRPRLVNSAVDPSQDGQSSWVLQPYLAGLTSQHNVVLFKAAVASVLEPDPRLLQAYALETSQECPLEETPVEQPSDVSLETMSKKELEDYGRTIGIELDRRHSKKDLIEEVKAAL